MWTLFHAASILTVGFLPSAWRSNLSTSGSLRRLRSWNAIHIQKWRIQELNLCMTVYRVGKWYYLTSLTRTQSSTATLTAWIYCWRAARNFSGMNQLQEFVIIYRCSITCLPRIRMISHSAQTSVDQLIIIDKISDIFWVESSKLSIKIVWTTYTVLWTFQWSLHRPRKQHPKYNDLKNILNFLVSA